MEILLIHQILLLSKASYECPIPTCIWIKKYIHVLVAGHKV
jgi:hypothetical protein